MSLIIDGNGAPDRGFTSSGAMLSSIGLDESRMSVTSDTYRNVEEFGISNVYVPPPTMTDYAIAGANGGLVDVTVLNPTTPAKRPDGTLLLIGVGIVLWYFFKKG